MTINKQYHQTFFDSLEQEGICFDCIYTRDIQKVMEKMVIVENSYLNSSQSKASLNGPNRKIRRNQVWTVFKTIRVTQLFKLIIDQAGIRCRAVT